MEAVKEGFLTLKEAAECITECKDDGQSNRRNGKTKKTLITEWRTRPPLEAVYPIVFLDAMHFKIREEGKVVSKAIYSILGVNKDGRKEIIGIYLSESEGARFWLGVLNDLRTRGIDDILIASIDGLKGFPEAIGEVFPKAEIQLCIVQGQEILCCY